MKPPAKLYRYRPLTDDLLDREMQALRDSYLFAPAFGAMNDPMEAFYETGGPGDWIVDVLLAKSGKTVDDLYAMLKETVDRFALVSFSSSHQALPLWAYYGSNFAGMCLEFDTAQLSIGDFQNEKLRQVTYAQRPLGPLTIAEWARDQMEEAIIARLTRKRTEWSHEKEWRFMTGVVGPKHYLDDALTRVFLGPRTTADHARRVCDALDRRPVEVLKASIHGFEMTFDVIKPARPLADCERVGAGRFDPANDLFAAEDLRAFLEVPFDVVLEECRRTVLRPNMESFAGIDLAGSDKKLIYLWTAYKLRSGREVYQKRYFDRHFKLR